jgi:hypothetical protein
LDFDITTKCCSATRFAGRTQNVIGADLLLRMGTRVGSGTA